MVGLVLATDARFHTTSMLTRDSDHTIGKALTIKIVSKQFKVDTSYSVDLSSNTPFEASSDEACENKFLFKCIYYLLKVLEDTNAKNEVIERFKGKTLVIELVGDNSFYS